ncbi:MAG: Hsp20/alpha crystallin family protein [Saprospiraceae bacterium]|jgi:HSP20 family protein|nr:Hsp20/alpha crystallin family protein [Saprospiraceae bacterium]
MWKSNYQSNFENACDTQCRPNHHRGMRPENKTYKIPMNVVEDDTQFELRMNVTGFTKEEVSISTNENILTVKSQKPAQEPDTNSKKIHAEFRIRNAERKIILPANVKIDEIKAKYNEGVLIISLPKSKPETININL